MRLFRRAGTLMIECLVVLATPSTFAQGRRVAITVDATNCR